MEIEWHVSDSEEEDNVQDSTPKISNSRLEKLSTLSGKDTQTCFDQHYMPRNLVDLYERIENEGFIALRCQGSQRPVSIESKEDETQNILVTSPAAAVDKYENPPNALTIENSNDSAVKSKPLATFNEFDYDEELFEPPVMFPRRTPKSGKKIKRVGTMENVISDINRFRELNAQTIANQKQQ